MTKPQTVCVVGTFPDHLNTNRNIRHFIASACGEFYSDSQVFDVSHADFFEAIPNLNPDLSIFVGSILASDFQVQSMLDTSRRCGSRVVVWLHDDPYEFDAGYRLQDLVDAVFSNDKASTYHYPTSVPAFHLPMAAPRPVTPPRLERDGADYFFTGYPYPSRLRLFGDLGRLMKTRGRPDNGSIVGPNWDKATVPSAIDARINQFQLYKKYQESLSVIYLGRDLNLKNERFRIRPSSPAPRLFEAASMGACQIAMTPGLEILDYYDGDDEICLVEDVSEIVDRIEMLKRRPSESVAIGLRAHRRTMQKHLYVHRIALMDNILGSL